MYRQGRTVAYQSFSRSRRRTQHSGESVALSAVRRRDTVADGFSCASSVGRSGAKHALKDLEACRQDKGTVDSASRAFVLPYFAAELFNDPRGEFVGRIVVVSILWGLMQESLP